MIEIKNRKMLMQREDRFLGFEHDNLIETRRFVLTDERLFLFDFKLDIKVGETKGIIDLDKEVQPDRIILTWQVRREHISGSTVFVQLRAFSAADEVWHSEQTDFVCGRSIDAVDSLAHTPPSELEQIERRVTQAKNEAVEAASAMADSVQRAAEAAERAEGSASDASDSAVSAKASADRAEEIYEDFDMVPISNLQIDLLFR